MLEYFSTALRETKMPNVKVLLKEKVEKLGEIGEIVSVKPGYARNYLLPNNLATLPTIGELKRIQKKKELLEKQYQEEKIQAEDIVKKLNALGDIVFFAKAGKAGKLFGTVTAKDIAEKINNQLGTNFQRKQVLLKRSIGELGEYLVKLKLHTEVTIELKIVLKNEE